MLLHLLISCHLAAANTNFKIIAHRGAPGYLPEHTLAGVAMSHSWGGDYIEADVVLSKDNHLVVLHDIHIDTTTNVKKVYPKRGRNDGRFYAIDFTLAELKKLSVHERINLLTGKKYFKQRFSLNKSQFLIPTFSEFIELVQGLNASTGKNVGIYPEIKKPEFHLKEGKDITLIFVEMIKKYKYTQKNQSILIQCFFPPTLKRLKHEFKLKIPLVQLIDNDSKSTVKANYKIMKTQAGLNDIANYAKAVGPWWGEIIHPNNTQQKYRLTKFVKWAHANKLQVHPYTHRKDELPSFVKNSTEFLDILIKEAKIDGIFSDFADMVQDHILAKDNKLY